jgi:hypothetical protein
MAIRCYIAQVGAENALFLATRGRTALLASEYRPVDLGDGSVSLTPRALDASRELGEEDDGYITEDGEGLRIWVGEDAFDLVESYD